MAPKTKGSPKSKANPKKQKKQELAEEQLQEEEQELAPAGEEDVEEYEEEGDVPAEEGPAGATRAKAGPGGSAATGAKRSAVSASTNGLPQARPTIVDILLGDHRDTVALLKRFEEVAKSDDKLLLEKLTDAIAITIRLHSQAEFEVLYPLMEKRLGSKGKEASQHSIEAHSKIEQDLLTALENRKGGAKGLSKTMKEILDAFVEHLREEEDELVPQMLAQMSEEEQVELAQSFMAAKAKAPLIPQPVST